MSSIFNILSYKFNLQGYIVDSMKISKNMIKINFIKFLYKIIVFQ